MADGNFNTKILPPGGFASGLRTGEARMKQRSQKAFREVLCNCPQLAPEEIELLERRFNELLTL